MKKIIGSRRAYSRYLLGLFLLVFGVGISNACFPTLTRAANPSSGQVAVTAKVNGPPPATASSIDLPTNNQVFSQNPITVAGTCPADGLIIKIINNQHMVGSAICKNGGNFTVIIDLFRGKNILVAQEFDSLGQKGPDSAAVIVYYNPPPLTSPGYPAGHQPDQLTIALDSSYSGYTGCAPDQQLSLPFRIRGGTAPYAVRIDWGDGSDELVSLKSAKDSLVAVHSYNQAGTYQVSVNASDEGRQRATFNVVVVINGQPKSVASIIGGTSRKVWQFPLGYSVAGTAVLLLGFVLGKLSRPTYHHSN